MAVGGMRRAGQWGLLLVAVLVAVVVWGLVVLVASEPRFKGLWDLSPQEIGTVSPLTRQLIEEIIEEDRVLEFHLIPERPQAAQTPEQEQLIAIRSSVQQQTWDLLQQYSALGGSRVQVRFYDPYADADDMRELTAKYPVQADGQVIIVLGDRHDVVSMVHDLAEIDHGERLQMAPGAKPLPQLDAYLGEQVLSSRIKELLVTDEPVVYFLKGLQLSDPLTDAGGQGFGALKSLLEQDGMVVKPLTLESGDSVPADASAVALVEPVRDGPSFVADALERFVRKGGRLFVNPSWSVIPDHNASLEPLGVRFGFQLGPRLVCRPLPDVYSNGVRYGVPANAEHDVVGDRMLNRNYSLTEPFAVEGRHILVGMPRELGRRPEAPAGVRPDPSLIRSQPSWLEEPRGMAGPDFRPPSGPQAVVQAQFAPRCLGMVVDVDGDAGETGHVLILSGQVFNKHVLDRNSNFALSVFNWLTSRDVLVGIRAKRYENNRMDVEPHQLERTWFATVVVVPAALLVLCVIVFWRRSRS